jgi:creatinine amidohydrolase
MHLPRQWTDLHREHLGPDALADAVAVLPVAAVEQHGPHLPLGVDLFIMEFCLARALAVLPPGLAAILLPVQAVGVSTEHLAFPGTLTLPPDVAVRAWTALGEAVHRAGCRRIVLVSSHGGNTPAMEMVALDLRVRLGMAAVTTAWSRFGLPPGLEAPGGHDWHGGFAETSLMLATRPDLVDMARAEDFVSRGEAMEASFRRLRATRPAGFAWMAQDLNPQGALGNAAAATAEAGHAIAEHAATGFAELLGDVARFTL